MSAHSFLCVCACLLLGVVTSGVSLWGSLPLTQKHTHTHTPAHTCTHTMACGFFRCSFWARAIVDAYPAFRFCNGHWVHPLHTHTRTHTNAHTHNKVSPPVSSWHLPMHSSAPVPSNTNHFSDKMPNVCAISINWTRSDYCLKVNRFHQPDRHSVVWVRIRISRTRLD